MLTFSFESEHLLLGCGIDCEKIERFAKYIDHPRPLRLAFTPKEVEHISTLEDQALGFCASFTCKEAFFKAAGKPFKFTDCELFFVADQPIQRPTIPLSLQRSFGITDCTVRFYPQPQEELLAIVHLFGEKR